MTVLFSPPLKSSLDAFLQFRCSLRMVYGVSSRQCNQGITIPSLTAFPVPPSDINFFHFYGASVHANWSALTLATNRSEFTNVSLSSIQNCVAPSAFFINVSNLPETINRMPCVRVAVSCGQWVTSDFSPPDIDASASWDVLVSVVAVEESGARVMFSLKRKNESATIPTSYFPFTDLMIVASTSGSDSDNPFRRQIPYISVRRDSFFAIYLVPLAPCSGEITLGYTISCGFQCFISNSSFDRIQAFCAPLSPLVFVSLVAGSSNSSVKFGNSTMLSPSNFYTLALSLPSFCGSMLVNFEGADPGNCSWSSGWVTCSPVIQIPVLLNCEAFAIVARASDRFGQRLSPWTSSSTLSGSISHFSTRCDLFSNCTARAVQPSSFSNVSVTGVISLSALFVRFFFAAPSDAILMIQLRCFCNDATSDIVDTYMVTPGKRELDAYVPPACVCVVLLAPASVVTTPAPSISCFSPPSVLPLGMYGFSSCLVFERSFSPCFSFVSPPYAVSAVAAPSSNYTHASLTLEFQGHDKASVAQLSEKLGPTDAKLYGSIFSATCDSCGCSPKSAVSITFDRVDVISGTTKTSFECSLTFKSSDSGPYPSILCPISAFIEDSPVSVVLSVNGTHSKSPAISCRLSPSKPIFVLQPYVTPLFAEKSGHAISQFPSLNVSLQFQVYSGALPVQCFLNISSPSSSRTQPLNTCNSADISRSMLQSSSGGFLSVVAVNTLGSSVSLPIPLVQPPVCGISLQVEECSHDSIALHFDYVFVDSSSTHKLLLTSGTCREVAAPESVVSVFDISSFPPGMSISSLESSSSFCLVLYVNDVLCSRVPVSTAPVPLSFVKTTIVNARALGTGQPESSFLIEWEYPTGAESCSISAVLYTYCNWDSAWYDVGSSFVVPCIFQKMTVAVPSYWKFAKLQVRSTNGDCKSSYRDYNVTINASMAVPPMSVPPFINVNSSDSYRPTATISWSLSTTLHASVISLQLHLIRLSCSASFNSSCTSPASLSTIVYDVLPSFSSHVVDLVPSATYAVRIILLNDYGPSIPSVLSNIVSTLTPPPLPSVSTSVSSFSFMWSDSSASGNIFVDVWNGSNWDQILLNAPIRSSLVTVNSSVNQLYRFKVSAITEVFLESGWIGFHTLVPPQAVSFDRNSSNSNNVFRISWQAMVPESSAEIGFIARLCTRRFNVSEAFTCSRVFGSASACHRGLAVPTSVKLVSSISVFDATLAPFASLIMCSRNASFFIGANNETKSFVDMPLEIRNTVAYVQVAKVSWFGMLSAWSHPSQQISYPVDIKPTASIVSVRFGSSPALGTPSVVFQMNASDVRLQLIRAVAIVAVPGDRACPFFDFAALGDSRCVQRRSLICTENGNNRTCENILHCDIAPFIANCKASSGAILSYSGLSYLESNSPFAHLPLSVLPIDAPIIAVSIIAMNSWAVSSPSLGVLVTLPCQPPSDVSLVQTTNGADVRFVSTIPCIPVLRLWAISTTDGVYLLRELKGPESPVSLRLLPRGAGLAVTLASVDQRGVESASSSPVVFVLPPDTPTDVRTSVLSQDKVMLVWSVPVFPVVERVPYYGYSVTPLSDIAAAFAASEYGDVAYSQRVVAASLEIGVVVHSVNSSLSDGSLLLSPFLRSSPIIYVARSSFGVRSDWVPVFQDSALVDTNTSSNAPNIQQAWCVLKTEGSAAVGGVFISSSDAGAVLVAATRCGVGSVANISIQSAVSSASSETLNFGDDGMGHASLVVLAQSWPHPKFAVGRIVTVLSPNQPRSSCQLGSVGSLQTSPVVFECSPCTTLAVPGDSFSSIGYKYNVHWTVLLTLNTKLQPSDHILAKAVRVAHQ